MRGERGFSPEEEKWFKEGEFQGIADRIITDLNPTQKGFIDEEKRVMVRQEAMAAMEKAFQGGGKEGEMQAAAKEVYEKAGFEVETEGEMKKAA